MPPPALISSVRYTDQATSVAYWLPSIAAVTLVPTRAEMNAGTNLTGELNTLTNIASGSTGGSGTGTTGWTMVAERINTQNITNNFTTEIAGSLSTPDASLTFFASKNGRDIRLLLAAGTGGYVMFCDGGDIGNNYAEVWPVQVAALSLVRVPDGSDAVKVSVQFVVTGQPAQRVLIPT